MAKAFVTVLLVSALLVPAILEQAGARGGSSCPTSRADEGFHRRLNKARADHGLEPLVLDGDLNKVSRRHTAEMIQAGGVFHTPSDKLAYRVTNWEVLRENVGRGRTVRSLHRSFMQSSSHREVILDPRWTYVGINARRSGGRLWVTFTFEAYDDPGNRVRCW